MPDSMAPGVKVRRDDYDWLRVIFVGLVFLYHCAVMFHTQLDWIIMNPDRYFVVDFVCYCLEMWGLDTFFMVSGGAAWFALRSRTSLQYILARVKRLLLPIYSLGLFILLPFMYYFLLAKEEGFKISYFELYPIYFSKMFDLYLQPSDLLPLPYESYFWFLKFLFLISLFTLPVLHFLRSKIGLRLIDMLAWLCAKPGGIFVFILPMLMVRISLNSIYGGWNNWAVFALYTVSFVIGFILAADKRFTESINRHIWIGLAVGLVCYAITVYYRDALGYDYYYEPFSSRFVVFQTIFSTGQWSWIIVLLAIGAKYMNKASDALNYCNEAVLPFYILHLPVVMVVAFVVVSWDLGILAKYLLIAISSFAIVLILYNFLVRPFDPVRFFFGMAPKPKPIKVPAGPQNSAA